MIALIVIIGGVVGGAYVLSAKSSSGHTQPTGGVNAAGDSQKPATSDSAAPKQPAKQQNMTPPAASAPSTLTNVTINGKAFEPAASTVKKGTTVTWVNKDTANHAVGPNSSNQGGQAGPRSPQLKPNESYTYTFSAAGTYNYIDVLNPSHTGTISVTE